MSNVHKWNVPGNRNTDMFKVQTQSGLALDRCSHGVTLWNNLGDYYALLLILAQLGNPRAFLRTEIPILFEENHNPWPRLNDLVRAIDGRHNSVAYLVAIFLYRHNGNASDDDTARQYMRQVEGEEESQAAATGGDGGPMSRWLWNKGCAL